MYRIKRYYLLLPLPIFLASVHANVNNIFCMKDVRTQGNTLIGIFIILLCTVFIAFFVYLNFFLHSFHFMEVFAYAIFIFGIVVGVQLIIKDKRGLKVHSRGYQSTAVVIRKYSWTNGYRSRIPHYSIVVSFISASGHPREEKFDIYKDDYDTIDEGTAIYCKVFGESCFIDKNNIKILSDIES